MDAKDLICGHKACGGIMKREKSEQVDNMLTFVTYKCPNGHLMTEARRSNPQVDLNNIPWHWVFGV